MLFRPFMAALLLALALAAGAATAAKAAAMSEVEYETALAFIGGTETVMAEAEAALEDSHAGEAAAVRRDELASRAGTLRRMMTEAARQDRIGARANPKNGNVAPERARARDVIARAGAIEERLQDLWTVWSQRARGDFSGCIGAEGYRPC